MPKTVKNKTKLKRKKNNFIFNKRKWL